MSLLHTQTSETDSGLSTTTCHFNETYVEGKPTANSTVLLWKVDGELVKNIARVTTEGSKECAVSY